MEIERKFLVAKENLPAPLERFSYHEIEQGYLCVNPVVRVRRQDDTFFLTYKGKGMMVREEYNLPLTEEGYDKLIGKIDGRIIQKKRYLIPLNEKYTAELDEFKGDYEGLWMAEVEFENEEEAGKFIAPDWFGTEVTYDKRYHNSYMSLAENKEEQ